LLLFLLKLTGLTAIIILYIITSCFISLFCRKRPARIKKLAKNLSFISRLVLGNLGIRANLINRDKYNPEDNYLILCNHLSYTDILIISSMLPSTFITSFEVKATKFLGGLSRTAGSIFVDRVNYSNIRKEISQIKDLISQGVQVVLFPEATSSDGETVLPFKSGLMECIYGSGKKILLCTLNYKRVNKSPVDKNNRDILYWYGDMTFFPHLTALLKSGSIYAEIDIIGEVEPSDFLSRKELSAFAHHKIKETYLKNRGLS